MKSKKKSEFQNDLEVLREKTAKLFDQMQESDKNPFEIAEKLKASINDLCVKHLVTKCKKPKEKPKVAVEKQREDKYQGEKENAHVGVSQKNSKGQLRSNRGMGLKVIENDSQVYSGQIAGKDAQLGDVVYIKPLNCYLQDHNY